MRVTISRYADLERVGGRAPGAGTLAALSPRGRGAAPMGRALKAGRKYLSQGARAARSTLRKLFGRSDRGKWERPDRLRAHWDPRTIRLAALVPPGTRVLEFGAGRMILREHLPPDCHYIPTDLVARTPDMLVCDLNARRLPDLPDADVAVFGGVLEFVNNVPRTLSYLRDRGFRYVVTSYMGKRDAQHRQVLKRRKAGVVNDYTLEELVSLFERHGFRYVAHDVWFNHDLFKFERAQP